jgi:alginate O-acetyltransferase complex protein AlgI
MRELWQRWHTSLGWWFTEFVGRPLGGAGRGRVRASINVLIIFALIGLWHGPAWTFVVWGLFNGALVVLWRNLPTPRGQHPMKIKAREIPRIVRTFLLFGVGVVFFRAGSFDAAGTILERIATLETGQRTPVGSELVPIMLLLVLVADVAERRRRIDMIETTRTRAQLGGVATPAEAALESPIVRLPAAVGGLVVGAMVLAIVIFSGGAPTPFIYFQF